MSTAVQAFILGDNIPNLTDPARINLAGGLNGIAIGVGGLSTDGSVNVNNNADIDVQGNTFAVGVGGASGTPSIATQFGLPGYGDPETGGPITINNGGDIAVSGSGFVAGIGAQSGEHGLFEFGEEGPVALPGTPGSNILITNEGDIHTEGGDDSGSFLSSADAIHAFSNGGDVTVVNAGDLSAAGANFAEGISVLGGNGSSVDVNNSGGITGVYDGIAALLAGGDGTIKIDNSGNITARGTLGQDQPAGLLGESGGTGAITIINTGDIDVTSPYQATAIQAESYGLGDITITNGGDLTVNAGTSGGVGIFAGSSPDGLEEIAGSAAINIDNSGKITVNGDHSAGIEAVLPFNSPDGAIGSPGTIDITTSDDVTATGEHSVGISTISTPGSSGIIRIEDGATVSGGSGSSKFGIQPIREFFPDVGEFEIDLVRLGSAGIMAFGGGEVTINNFGQITALNGQAIQTFSGDILLEEIDWEEWDGEGLPPVIEQIQTVLATNITVNNSGNINGNTNLGEGTNSFTNSGTVTGDVTAGDGNDAYQNDGTHTGDLALGGGNNTIGNTSPLTLNGNVTTGSGEDTYANSGVQTGNVDLGDGTNDVTNSGTLTGNLTTGSGVDRVNNSGTITGDADLGDGGNFFTNLLGGIFGGDVTTGKDDDTVANAGQMEGATDLGEGTNSFTNTGTVTGDVTAGDGDDTYQNDGTHTGNVALGGGNNTIGNTSPDTLIGDVTTGSGDDAYANSGVQTGNVDLGDGGNFFTNLLGGIFGGNLTTGADNDEVANAGGMIGDVDLGGGTNSFSNTGGFQGDLAAGAGDDTATNSGVFDGNVNLGGGTNSFTNLAGGVFAPGSTVNVGTGGLVANAGDLLPGGNGVIQTTTITGNFTQTATGTIGLDINDQGQIKTDRVLVSGTADLAGNIVPNIINLSDGKQQFIIIVADGGAVNSGLAVKVADTVGFDFEVEFAENGKDVILTSDTPETIEEVVVEAVKEADTTISVTEVGNAQNMAVVLNESAKSSPALQQLVTALRALGTEAELVSAVERLTPKAQAAATTGAVTGVASAGNAMLSCQVRDGDNTRYTREGQCYWAKVTVRRLDRDATSKHSGVEENGVEVMGGLQWALWDELRLGVALGYADTDSDSTSQTQRLGSSDGERFTAGLVLKNQWGPVNAYLNLVGSYGSYDLTRIVGLGFGNAQAEQDVTSFMTRLRVSYLMDGSGLYMRPMVDLNATYVSLDGYRETGAGAANLVVASTDEWFLSVTPAVEIGGEARLGNDTVVRPYIRGGVTFIDQDSMSVDVNFAGAPAGVQPFTVNSELEDMYGIVEAGLHILTPEGFNFKLSYDGRFAEDSQEHAGTLKIGKNF